MIITGWDIGGAHIKVAKINFEKNKIITKQIYSPVWKNINNLYKSIKKVNQKIGHCNYHSITMTAELSDIFLNRKKGTAHIVNLCSKIFGKKKIYFYNKKKFLKKKEALNYSKSLSSLNWHASANLISNYLSNCILVDIGSTTTDIITIKNNKVNTKGKSDCQRLKSKELLYIGVLRTPLFAIERKKNLIFENFSDLSDIYRILKKIPKKFDTTPTNDNKGKDKHSSARRVARVFGDDYKKKKFSKWKNFSIKIKKKQEKILKENINNIKKKNFSKNVPVIGAGIGEFLLKKIYKNKNYSSFYKKINYLKKNTINCEAAISSAILLNNFLKEK